MEIPSTILADTPDDGDGATVYLHRVENADTDRNGNTGRSLYCTDRKGAPLLLVIPGSSSYTNVRPGRWVRVIYGGRLPRAPYDGRVSSLLEY